MTESSFDIHTPLTDHGGAPDRGRINVLLGQFFDSPEFEEYTDRYPDFDLDQTRQLLSPVLESERTKLTEIDPDLLEYLLLEHSPRRVAVFDIKGEQAIAQCTAFFAFLYREFGIDKARSCIQYLQTHELADDFEEAMNDPENFGVVKCITFLGERAGFDMSDRQEMKRFAAIYSEAIAGAKPLPPDPGARFESSSFLENIFSRYDYSPQIHNLFECLMNAGTELYDELHRELLQVDPELLIQFLDDRDLAVEQAPGKGWIPIHSARVLGERNESEAIDSLIRAVIDTDSDGLLSSVANTALKQIGTPVLEPVVNAIQDGVDADTHRSLKEVLTFLEDWQRYPHR